MTTEAVVQLVTGLYAAAGRTMGEVELAVYAKVLEHVPDDVGLEAGEALWAHVSWETPPSPRRVLDAVQSVHRRRQKLVPALTDATGPPVSAEQAKANLARIRSMTLPPRPGR